MDLLQLTPYNLFFIKSRRSALFQLRQRPQILLVTFPPLLPLISNRKASPLSQNLNFFLQKSQTDASIYSVDLSESCMVSGPWALLAIPQSCMQLPEHSLVFVDQACGMTRMPSRDLSILRGFTRRLHCIFYAFSNAPVHAQNTCAQEETSCRARGRNLLCQHLMLEVLCSFRFHPYIRLHMIPSYFTLLDQECKWIPDLCADCCQNAILWYDESTVDFGCARIDCESLMRETTRWNRTPLNWYRLASVTSALKATDRYSSGSWLHHVAIWPVSRIMIACMLLQHNMPLYSEQTCYQSRWKLRIVITCIHDGTTDIYGWHRGSELPSISADGHWYIPDCCIAFFCTLDWIRVETEPRIKQTLNVTTHPSDTLTGSDLAEFWESVYMESHFLLEPF